MYRWAGRWTVGILSAVLLAAMSQTASTQQPEAKGVVAVRQKAMDSLGGHSAAIQKILTEYPELANQVPLHAAAIAALAPLIPTWFPEGSTSPQSKALPAIWEKKSEFDNHAKTLADLAGKLELTAKAGDNKATLAAFADMGKQGCGGCHQPFRQKTS